MTRCRLGIEKVIEQGPAGTRRIGLLSNQSAILPDGTTVWQALRNAGFPIVRLFAPEHGFLAAAQDTVPVEDTALEGIETVSLYGVRKQPAPEHLSDLDVLLVDIQDVGCRYYTYLYTVAAAIEQCARTNTEVVVCDRPNPIGASIVEGGAVAEEASSEVGGYGLAQRHGLTLCEFVRYLTREYVPAAPIRYAWMDGYTRDTRFEHTGLPWKQPSPNLPSIETARVYPGTCLFEGTTVSEGRGTTRPFEIIGAPWVRAEELRDALSELLLPGVAFSTEDFTPTFSSFAEEACRGVQLHVTDPETFRPLYTGVHMIIAIKEHAPEHFSWRPLWEDPSRSFADRLAGGDTFRRLVDRGAGAEEAYAVLCRGGEQFREARVQALYYDYAEGGL